MPSSPTGPLSMKKPPSLMLSAVTPTSVAPPFPWAGPGAGARAPDPLEAAAAVPGTTGASGPAALEGPPGAAAAVRADGRPPGMAAVPAALAAPAAGVLSGTVPMVVGVGAPATAVVGVAAVPSAVWPASAPRCFGCSPAQAALTTETVRTRMSIERCRRRPRTLPPRKTSNGPGCPGCSGY